MPRLVHIIALAMVIGHPPTAGAEAAPSVAPFQPFSPLRAPSVPVVPSSWPINDIDRFIAAAHQAHRLSPVADAPPATLIRRLSFDLTGLPPRLDDIDAFTADPSPAVYTRIVDRLLASPAHGERWARHWLDCVRYADTAGCNSDFPVPSAFKYRNWVIDALNRDTPFDTFVRLQIAGDLVPVAEGSDRPFDNTIATGYLAVSRRFGSRLDDAHLTIEDTIDNLGKTFLGLSINCARCHDHKYDPISVDDYYALYGIFQSTRYAFPGVEIYPSTRDFIFRARPDDVALIRGREKETAELDQRIEDLGNELRRLERERTAGKATDAVPVVSRATRSIPVVRAERETARARRDQLRHAPNPFENAYAVRDVDQPANARVHVKGDPKSPGPEVPRRFLAALGGDPLPPDTTGSGRLELARWITSHPLFARVIVNRVWHHHFGRGIVPTVNDFGARGEPPSHPALLDHLARAFIDHGWSLKWLHREIVHSRTFRLSSDDHPAHAAIDPANRYLWRFHRRRLSAEEVRDALLIVAGTLDPTPGAEHPFPPEHTWRFTQHRPFLDDYPTQRRSIYMMQQRIRRQPFLAVFDGADTNAATGDRPLSTTPLQALFFMNDPFSHGQARAFAQRVIAGAPDTEGRIRTAWRLALARLPTADESALAAAHIESARTAAGPEPSSVPLAEGQPRDDREVDAWESLCRSILSSNEFVYVD